LLSSKLYFWAATSAIEGTIGNFLMRVFKEASLRVGVGGRECGDGSRGEGFVIIEVRRDFLNSR
jgi:hypothetical protein